MWICKQCGMLFDTADSVCPECGEKVITLDEAFNWQGTLFDMEGNDRAKSVFDNLRGSYETACGDVRKAERKLAETQNIRDHAGEILMDFYKLTCDGSDGTQEALEEVQTSTDDDIDEWNGGSF
jgi:RNA polymerase subunit RPABC4/transcription elongation factor Spt4